MPKRFNVAFPYGGVANSSGMFSYVTPQKKYSYFGSNTLDIIECFDFRHNDISDGPINIDYLYVIEDWDK